MIVLDRRSLASALVMLFTPPGQTAASQHAHGEPRRAWHIDGMAQVVPLLTRATPTAGGRSITEGYLTQPMLVGSLSAFRGRLFALATLNLEGLSLRRGELNTGTYGEGYVDRRHPHSYAHELLATARTDFRAGGRHVMVSVTGGRGFAPFGSDDPMVRPFAKYPVNHHLAQILERVVVVAATSAGPVTLEVGVFNGDEPTGPASVPVWSRFGDSWSARATLRPAPDVEMAASVAHVQSPEFREGLGLDQRKRSLVIRVERPAGGGDSQYLLAEWARTHDDRHGRTAFTYTSVLAEGAYCRHRRAPASGGWSAALRLERTTRPEEERLFDQFRTRRPHIEFTILGRTRWTSVTVAVGTNAPRVGVFTIAPFLETTYARPERVERLAAFAPRDFYGSEQLWLLSAGARVNVGRRHHRMGRYGVAAPGPVAQPHTAPATRETAC